MNPVKNLKIKIFSDGAKIEDFLEMKKLGFIAGYTTNPTLMKKAGIRNYEKFIEDVLPIVEDKPISFEVIADDDAEMARQAVKLSAYGSNIYVKIPIMNTKRQSSIPLINELTHIGIKLNITAIMTLDQVGQLASVLKNGSLAFVSVFAGRIADTGRDPVEIIKKAKELCKNLPDVELLWASSRELLNIFQAQQAGCNIITVTPDIIKKLKNIDYNLTDFSHDTVQMFYEDAISSGLTL